ncbi:hypothetical protein QZH41_007501 [Actinostola sp. cb2023]|nr:hypothetical protein QZH41_007501 [Actinostola sp. cb2023]
MQSTLFSILIFSSLLCNSLIIVVFAKNKHMRKSINYFILNMAISDLLIPIVSIPVELERQISGSPTWKVHGMAGLLLCKVVYFLSELSPLVSTFSLVFMSLDRFFAIVYPTKRHIRTVKVRRYLLSLSWLVPVLYCLKNFYSYNLTEKSNYCGAFWGPPFDIHATTSTIIASFYTIVVILVPLVFMAMLYTAILYTLRKQYHRLHSNNIFSRYQQQLRQKQRKKINILAFSIVLAFAICYGPLYFYVYIMHSFVTKWHVPKGFFKKFIFPAYVLAYSNATINPLICIVFNTQFNKILKTMVSCSDSRSRYFTVKMFGLRNKYEVKHLHDSKAPAALPPSSMTYLA